MNDNQSDGTHRTTYKMCIRDREFVVDTFAYSVRGTEIHRSTLYFGNFTGRDRNFVDRRIEISVDRNDVVVDGRSRVGNTGEVEETVVSQVNDCSFVGGRCV